MYLLVHLFLCFHPIAVRGAWVEIPQLPSDKPKTPQKYKPAQFVFGAPKVSFVNQKPTTTTPSNSRMAPTTPKLPGTTLPNYKEVMTTPVTVSPLTVSPQKNGKNDEGPKRAKIEADKRTSNKDLNAYSGFLPVLHNIQETVTLHARKSLNSKIAYLASLRDDLLTSIDERMSSLWSEHGPEARGYDDKEMDFPSNEGALMTIGFLTFAVFLIKLVLKLIHTLKNKSITTNTTLTTGTATTYIGRKTRAVGGDDDALKILQYIEEYKFS